MPLYRVQLIEERTTRSWIDVEAIDVKAANETAQAYQDGTITSAQWDEDVKTNSWINDHVYGVVEDETKLVSEHENTDIATKVYDDCDMCHGVGSIEVREGVFENCTNCMTRAAKELSSDYSAHSTGAELQKDYAEMRERVANLAMRVMAEQGVDAVDRMAMELSGDLD